MGGTGSGNYGGRPTIEAALKLDLYHLIRNGYFRSGATVTGSLAWTNTDTGEQKASIGYKAHMGEGGWLGPPDLYHHKPMVRPDHPA